MSETQSFFSRLEARACEVDSLLCVGLDPHPAELAEDSAAAARDFCLKIIEATSDLAAAYKPNAAFFERHGAAGWRALAEVIAAVPLGIPVILDAKRGDISSTADAYADSAFNGLKADALTVNPYLGKDALQPFLKDPARGAFILCKTSNPGAGDLQDLPVTGSGQAHTVYEQAALLAARCNSHDNAGLVVGATQVDALRRVRSLVPHLWILAPGVGAQGGDLKAALAAGLRADGLGMLVPVSRQISRAADPRQASQEICDAIRQVRRDVLTGKTRRESYTEFSASLADGLLKAGCVQFGSFTLKSGLQSPIYIDLRRLASDPALLAESAAAYAKITDRLEFSRMAALPYAALPIATALSLQNGKPMIYPRKEVKAYGTKAGIEGVYQPGERVVVIDDLATTGGSKFEAIDKLKSAELQVEDVVVLIDRQSGASEALAGAGVRLHSVFRLCELLDHWEANGSVESAKVRIVKEFIQTSQGS